MKRAWSMKRMSGLAWHGRVLIPELEYPNAWILKVLRPIWGEPFFRVFAHNRIMGTFVFELSLG